jgi:hypothetical protein
MVLRPMNDTVIRSIATTLAITLVLCALTVGKNAGILWWATTTFCIYPFTHLAYRHHNNK